MRFYTVCLRVFLSGDSSAGLEFRIEREHVVLRPGSPGRAPCARCGRSPPQRKRLSAIRAPRRAAGPLGLLQRCARAWRGFDRASPYWRCRRAGGRRQPPRPHTAGPGARAPQHTREAANQGTCSCSRFLAVLVGNASTKHELGSFKVPASEDPELDTSVGNHRTISCSGREVRSRAGRAEPSPACCSGC